MRLAFRRMPQLFGALFLVVLPLALILFGLTMARGGDLAPNAIPPVLAIPAMLVLLLALFVFVRLLFLTPLAADADLGPVGLLKHGWGLSRGRAATLFLLVLLLLLVAAVLVIGLGGALATVIILALGEIAPGNVSALLVGLVRQMLAATVTVLFVVVVCRVYAQAKSGATHASVPSAGGE